MLFGPEHVRHYVETGGEEGHDWQGTTALILTTKGRKSGESRSTPLIYGRNGDDYLIVASLGGAPRHPQWYLNLQAESEVELQVKGDRFKARARTATEEEKPALWETMVAKWAPYADYQKKTDREIPVVVLQRA
jgi:deazaflavin-dependent oxidoreductase (nitroreductase family)